MPGKAVATRVTDANPIAASIHVIRESLGEAARRASDSSCRRNSVSRFRRSGRLLNSSFMGSAFALRMAVMYAAGPSGQGALWLIELALTVGHVSIALTSILILVALLDRRGDGVPVRSSDGHDGQSDDGDGAEQQVRGQELNGGRLLARVAGLFHGSLQREGSIPICVSYAGLPSCSAR